MNDIFAEVADLKDQARLQRKDRNFAGATATLERAIAILEDAMSRVSSQLGPASAFEKTLAKQLSDLHGTSGGNYRDLDQFKRSAGEYDKGYRYESNPRYGIVSSYNMVNRLVSRLLYARDFECVIEPGPITLHQALVQASAEIDAQLRRLRKGDCWAIADLALTRLLTGDDAGAATAYGDFDRTNPPKFAYESSASVLNTLAGAGLPMQDRLENARDRLLSTAGKLRT